MGKVLLIGIAVVIIIAVTVWYVMAGWKTVGAGERGVLLQWGAATGDPLAPGLHIVTPISQDVALMNVQVQVTTQPTEASSSDLQDVGTTVAVNYHVNPEDVTTLYRMVGTDYATKIIDPAIQETVKQVAAKFSASELITQRPLVKQQITDILTKRLGNYNINVDAVSITNFSFSPTFNQAIEAKVVAIQQAEQAENQLQTIKIQAQQTVATANGTAQSILLVNKAIEQSPYYLKYLGIKTWNGQLPKVLGAGAIPFISLGNETR